MRRDFNFWVVFLLVSFVVIALALTVWSGATNVRDQRLRQQQAEEIFRLQEELHLQAEELHQLNLRTDEEMNAHRCRSEQLLGVIIADRGAIKPPYPDGVHTPVNCPFID